MIRRMETVLITQNGQVVTARDGLGNVIRSTDAGFTWQSLSAWARPAGLRDRERRRETEIAVKSLDHIFMDPAGL